MTSGEIEEKLHLLIEKFDRDEFIYDFLLAYGISKTSISRLKKGDFNLSQVPGEVLYKNKLFFKVAETDKLLFVADECAKEERIRRQSPRFVIVTDHETLVAKDLKTKLNRDFKISELPRYFDFFLPLSGAEVYKASNDNKADRDAAYQLAQLYDTLITDNAELYQQGAHDLNVFLSRLLFCFFAEDTGIFEKVSVFTETLSQHTAADGSDVHLFLNSLFARLNTKKGNFADYLEQFPYVNGGLFNHTIASPVFSAKSRNILLTCGDLDWSEINPDIFGSMIQAVTDPKERSNLGMHYTSVPNIKKVIEPLFLDDLNSDFQKNLNNPVNLKKLINRISKIKFFDPACGSGNFLIITYKEIRSLEIEIIKRLIELEKAGGVLTLYFTSINLSQFYGIEIKDFAHEMAMLSLWLAEHQMNNIFEQRLEGFGRAKPILPLKEAGKIVCANAARIPWEDVCPRTTEEETYLLGNPPYYGARKQDKEQKQDVALVLRSIRGYNNMDYVSIWFYKAKKYIQGIRARCAFVTTNSVCQGEQVPLLWPQIVRDDIEIDFAHHSFKWTNNAKGNAGVTVIIVGLRNRSGESKYLYYDRIKKNVKNINGYLLDSNNIYVLPRTKSLCRLPEMNFGNMANDKGHLLLSPSDRDLFLKHDARSAPFIKKLVGALEFIRGQNKYCLWIEDEQLEKANAIADIRDRISRTYESRLKSKRKSTRELAAVPYKFAEVRYQPTDAIIIPSVSSEKRAYIPLGFLNNEHIIVAPNLAIYDAQPWLFGILHSRLHMVWVSAIGGRLKTDYRYSVKLCYNTFPFPEISVKQKEMISQYVFQIMDERAKYPEKTMAWLYGTATMPKGLREAHKELDDCIERLYRLAPFDTDAERLEYLFRMYEEEISKNTIFSKQKKIKAKSK